MSRQNITVLKFRPELEREPMRITYGGLKYAQKQLKESLGFKSLAFKMFSKRFDQELTNRLFDKTNLQEMSKTDFIRISNEIGRDILMKNNLFFNLSHKTKTNFVEYMSEIANELFPPTREIEKAYDFNSFDRSYDEPEKFDELEM